MSDGVFAIAMTLLVLDLHAPVKEQITNDLGLLDSLGHLAPNLLTYFMSFMTLGIFWIGQQTQLSSFKHSNRYLTWTHLFFLLLVTLIPFTTSVLADFLNLRSALFLYWLNILLMGSTLYLSVLVATRNQLFQEEDPGKLRDLLHLLKQRIIFAQALYITAMLLCFWNVLASVIAIIFVQLYFTVAPRIPLLDR